MKQEATSLLRSTAGFSLIEGVMAAGIGGVMIMGLLASMNSTNRTAKQMKSYNDWNQTLSLIRFAYSNQKACTNSFTGGAYSSGTGLLGLSKLEVKNDSGVTTTTFFDTAKAINGIKAQSIDLIEMASLGKQSVLVGTSTVQLNAYQVYLRIAAVRANVGATTAGSSTAAVTLSTGMGNYLTDPSLVSFFIYTNDGKQIQACSAAPDVIGCPDIEGGATTYQNVTAGTGPHVSHIHKPCQINSLALSPMATGDSPTTSMISFGDSQVRDVDTITDVVSTAGNSLILNGQGTMKVAAPKTLTLSISAGSTSAGSLQLHAGGVSSDQLLIGNIQIKADISHGEIDLSAKEIGIYGISNHYNEAFFTDNVSVYGQQVVHGDLIVKGNLHYGDDVYTGSPPGNVLHGCYQRTVNNVSDVNCFRPTTELATGGGVRCNQSGASIGSNFNIPDAAGAPRGWHGTCINSGGGNYTPDAVNVVCCVL